MKKIITVLVAVVLTVCVFAQAPQKMSYQAVIRNIGGVLVANQSIGIKISIMQGSPTGNPIYQETYSPNPQTNANGLVTVEIGSGTPLTGTFSTIDWSSGPYFLKTETDPAGGANYTISGTSQLLSVPYAIYSKKAQTADYNSLTNLPNLSVYLTTESDPVFGASPAHGITNSNITNWNTAYGWGNHAGLYRPIGYVPAWSEITGKPTTTSGYGITDAVMIATDQTITGIKTFSKDLLINGLTVGRGKGDINTNTAIGAGTLYSNTTGNYNTANGENALINNTTGNANTAIGYHTLYSNTTGGNNTANGYGALYSNTTGSSNTANGQEALYLNTTGSNNTANGYLTLRYNTIGSYNTATGYDALLLNTTGYSNTANGYKALNSNTTGNYNTANGEAALYSNTTGNANTANGYHALYSNTTGFSNMANGWGALYSNTTGSNNTTTGEEALYFNTSGNDNTANGYMTLKSNTTGSFNTANGEEALYSNTTGNSNTANGYQALNSNTTGDHVTAVGSSALGSNTTGAANTALGSWALYSNTTADYNTAAGNSSLMSNTTGSENTAIGVNALLSNTTGSMNVAVGRNALLYNQANNKNTAIGYNALENTTRWDNTAVGCESLVANTTGFDNTAFGMNSLNVNTLGCGNTAVGKNSMLSHITGDNNTAIGFTSDISDGITNATAIGYGASVTSSNKIVLGNASATTVGGYGSWTNYSDRRLKENIVYTNNLGLNFVLLLKPVSYNYINDSNKRRRDGLIAQDVEQTLKDLGIEFSGIIIDDDKDKTQNLAYAEFVIPLINSVKELSNKNQEQQKQIDELKALVNSLISNQAGQGNK